MSGSFISEVKNKEVEYVEVDRQKSKKSPGEGNRHEAFLGLPCSGSRLYDLWFFPIFSFKQTRGGSDNTVFSSA